MEKKILITGCSGFLGSNAVEYALKNRYKVVGFDRNNLTISNTKNKINLYQGDILDKEALQKASQGCKYVLHFAAMTSLPDFGYNLYQSYKSNILGFMNAIEAAKKNKCYKFIYASSSAVYQSKFTEDALIDIKRQRNHYAKSKLIDEMIADSYQDAYGMRILGLRYFNVYGKGEENKLRSSPISQFIKEKREHGTMTIFGDGKQSKDFINVNDAIRLTFMLMEDKNAYGIYNIGTGISTSFNEIARIINPKKIIYKKNPYLSSYIFYLKADTKKLKSKVKNYKFNKLEKALL